MDPATIATGVVTVLAPFVKKAAEEFAGEAGKAVLEKAKALLAKVKTKLSGDPFMAGTVERFEMEPEEYRDFFEKELRKQLEQDVAFAHELGALMSDIERAGPKVTVVQRVKKAKEVIAADVEHMSAGRLEAEQEAEDVEKATAVKIGTIGSGTSTKLDARARSRKIEL